MSAPEDQAPREHTAAAPLGVDPYGRASIRAEQKPPAVSAAGSPAAETALDRYPVEPPPGTQAPATQPAPVLAIEVDADDGRENALAGAAYRTLEILLALLALLVTLPVLLVVALLVRLESPGPALIFHLRAGKSRIMRGDELVGRTDLISPTGRFEPDKRYYVPTTFRLAKFRSMYTDSRERFPALFRYQYQSQAEFLNAHYKQEADPRVTRVGNWLRRLSLDEFPNFWNVLSGDISLVGPRPEIVSCLPFYTAEQMRKFTVRPGITGLAQTNGRSLLTIGQIIDWDLEYVRRRSAVLDLKILAATCRMLLTHRGAF